MTNFQGIWNVAVVVQSRCYLVLYVEGLRKFITQYKYRARFECKSRALPLQ